MSFQKSCSGNIFSEKASEITRLLDRGGASVSKERLAFCKKAKSPLILPSSYTNSNKLF